MDEIYLIKVWDPEANYGEGREFFDYRKGSFADKKVAEDVVNMMRMFLEKGSTVTFQVERFKFNAESTLDEWMDNNAPWRQVKETA